MGGPLSRLRGDARIYQIATLASLLAYGMGWLGFDVGGAQVAATLAAALATQAAFDLIEGRPPAAINVRSAFISGLSLCLLLRTDHLMLAVAAAFIAIAGKFTVRVGGKHVFNPTNGGLVAMMLLTDQVWVSPGQWGDAAFFAFLMACLGGLVVNRASRSDVTWAFLAFWIAIVAGRSLWLDEPLAIAWHRLQNGAFLLFAFFMISDPKTTPDSRAGRIVFALLVALGAAYVQFVLFRTNGLLWSLAAAAPLVPLLDRLLPGARYQWRLAAAAGSSTVARIVARLPSLNPYRARRAQRGAIMRRAAAYLLFAAGVGLGGAELAAFCGFYVAKADTKLFNRASQVVLVRDGDRTVITMANDYRGDPREFAMVVPVPTSITRDQINVADGGLLEHLDAFTSPRLVEYHDGNPCLVLEGRTEAFPAAAAMRDLARAREQSAKSLGVTIEAQYTVGEYDILILSASESRGLETWLRQNDYRIPDGAARILGSYIRQQMRFFVARVNLAEQSKLGLARLRPLQIAYESPKFMLPIRLGTVNADGPQELFLYALTRRGRVETTNYRTVRLPSDLELPVFLKQEGEFPRFYRALFDAQVRATDMRAVFLEYAWDMGWCDPCAADPLSADELTRLGVFWLDGGRVDRSKAGAQNVFVTRLHVRYDADHFPEDLVFQETGDRTNFQGRYILRHAWQGRASCEAAAAYASQLASRHEREAQTLASITGWNLGEIRRKMQLDARAAPTVDVEPWWRRLWNR